MKMKKVVLASLVMMAIFPMNGMAQSFDVDVHAGANLSGFASGKDFTAQDKKMKAGASLGVGLSYETKGKIVLSSGLDVLMTGGKFMGVSNYYSVGDKGPAIDFPMVNSREIALQIPLKVGYDFTLGKKWNFIPSVGVYGRYSIASLKQNVTAKTGENATTTFKRDCFVNYSNNVVRLDAYKRWDVGAMVEAKFMYDKHYSFALGYSRGFVDKSSQYGFKNHSWYLTLGYTL